jgi:hypothetical protein
MPPSNSPSLASRLLEVIHLSPDHFESHVLFDENINEQVILGCEHVSIFELTNK